MNEIERSVRMLTGLAAAIEAVLSRHRVEGTPEGGIVHKRGLKSTPGEQNTLCSEGDGEPILSRKLCRYHYYKARREGIKEKTWKPRKGAKRNGASTPAT